MKSPTQKPQDLGQKADFSPNQIVTMLRQYNSQISDPSPLCLCVVTDFDHNQLAAVKVKRLACLAFDKINGDNYIVDPEPI